MKMERVTYSTATAYMKTGPLMQDSETGEWYAVDEVRTWHPAYLRACWRITGEQRTVLWKRLLIVAIIGVRSANRWIKGVRIYAIWRQRIQQ